MVLAPGNRFEARSQALELGDPLVAFVVPDAADAVDHHHRGDGGVPELRRGDPEPAGPDRRAVAALGHARAGAGADGADRRLAGRGDAGCVARVAVGPGPRVADGQIEDDGADHDRHARDSHLEPISCSSRKRITPPAASRPNALPPVRSTAWACSTSVAGRSVSVQSVDDAAPLTSTPPTASVGGDDHRAARPTLEIGPMTDRETARQLDHRANPTNAGGGTRTPTGFRPPAPKAGVSTVSPRPRRESTVILRQSGRGRAGRPAKCRTSAARAGIFRDRGAGSQRQARLRRHPSQSGQGRLQGDAPGGGGRPAGVGGADADPDDRRLEQAPGPQAGQLHLVPALPVDHAVHLPLVSRPAADRGGARHPAADHRRDRRHRAGGNQLV